MIKYFAVAAILKIFSLNKITCSLYRYLGNRFGQTRRQNQDIDIYIKRGNQLIQLVEKYDILKNDETVVELGTGWLHWFGLYLSLHSKKDINLELFDVWDNRQLNALKNAFNKLLYQWKHDPNINEKQRSRLSIILSSSSFEDLYQKFNAKYTIKNDGSLASYPDASYNLITSFHVMEHMNRDSIEDTIGNMFRMLKPGGYCIHQIGIDDHLAHYDSTVSPKNYIQFSLSGRKYLFENVVQYHNVLQCADYQAIFQKVGFEIIETDREYCDITELSVHADWKKYPQEDLETTIFTIVCRKPV